MLRLAILTFMMAAATPAVARSPASCLDLKVARDITLTGSIAMRTFPGSPNFESVAKGDAPETVFILTLPRAMCADDGEFIEPAQSFRTVHVFANTDALNAQLRDAVKRKVSVTVGGEGFGAHTGHHHAPLMLEAKAVQTALPRRGKP